MSTNSVTVIPAGEGTVALHIPAELADATIGGVGGCSIVNLSSGWAVPRCSCHCTATAPIGGYLVCRLEKLDGEAIHIVETVAHNYIAALAAKNDHGDGEYRIIYSAYACGHYTY